MSEARVKAKRRASARAAVTVPAPKTGPRWWMYAAGAAIVLYVVFQAYGPALKGPFLFDDTVEPYYLPNFTSDLRAWISGVRPLLMFTYWVNYQFSRDPFGFHVLNVVFHVLNGVLLFFIVRKLLTLADPRGSNNFMLAGFAAAVFLLHPVQTEAVSYVAGRSECLSVLFFFAAFAVFLYRQSPAASWPVAIAVLVLCGAAVGAKEHTLVLPGLLLLTDYFWNPGFSFSGIRRNWRIYAPLALGGAAGLAFVAKLLAGAPSAGFHIKGLSWYQYFFTECRAFFVYLRLFVFPAGQNLDYDYPISRSILDHGAIFGLAAILLLAGAAIYFRRKYPLVSYGFLVYLLLMAPTSSFVPIKDALAERRLYLPMIGLLLIVVAGLAHVHLDRRKLAAAMGGVAVLLAIATWQRNQVWASETALWEDTVRKSPGNARAHFQLGHAYYMAGRYPEAAALYAETARLQQPNHDLLVDWGLAYDDAGQPDLAVAKLRQAAAMDPDAHVYSQIARVYAKQSRWPEALEALAQAEKLDPNYAITYYYRGGIRAKTNNFAAAVADYQRALALGLDPSVEASVRQGLAFAQQQLPRSQR
jgi:protein O-mannosyl-transferase